MEIEAQPVNAGPDRLVDKFFIHACALLLIAITAVMLYSVTMRYYFNRPPIWSEEALRVFFVWMTFLGLGVAMRRGLNVRVTYFVEMLRAPTRRMLEIVMHAIVLVFIGVLFVFSIPVFELSLGGRMLGTGWNNGALALALPLGCAIAFVYQARLLRTALRSKPT